MNLELQRFGLFHEPLLRTCDTSSEEDTALRVYIEKFSTDPSVNGIDHLHAFLASYPSSGWKLAILVNIALIYFHNGYFSLALVTLREAWRPALDASRPKAKPLADRAIGELIRMAARLGSADELTLLLNDIADREFTGPATQCIAGAKEGLWTMIHNPAQAFLCGPLALGNIIVKGGYSGEISSSLIERYKSRPGGVSIGELEVLSKECDLDFRAVYWADNLPYPVPSVVHLKLNHYAAIVARNGSRYLIQDPTFGEQDLWITSLALKSESTGYLLVPPTARTTSASRSLRPAELVSVRGMGFTSSSDPNATSPEDDKERPCDDGRGMCRYNMHSMLVSLNLVDTPVGYLPPRGPSALVTLTYNQREANQPAVPDFSNYGPKWTSNWLHYIVDDPEFPGNRVSRQVAGGGTRVYSGYKKSSGKFSRETMDGSLLVRATDSAVTYVRTLRDGRREIFAVSDGSQKYPRRIFLKLLVDRFGNSTVLEYDASFRLKSFTDATGRATYFGYDDQTWPLQVTRVTDPFDRTAHISYDSEGRLTQITDILGLASNFSYAGDDFVCALTTYCGTTLFELGESGSTRSLKITDPMGLIEYVEYRHDAPGIPDTESASPKGLPGKFNEYINARNTFYWDKHASQVASGDYTAARLKHWLHLRSNTAMTAGALESIKAPLEARVWFGYLGSSYGKGGVYDEPTYIGRVLDDGSTELTTHAYNANGNLALFTDSVGRQTSFVYAQNGVDVTAIHQKTAPGSVSTIAKYSYDSNHNISSYADAAGQYWAFTYSLTGELLTSSNPIGSLTTYVYDAVGHLLQIINSGGKPVLSLVYDDFGRVETKEDSEGYLLRFKYDAMDRITTVEFPDGTSHDLLWDGLDLIEASDRQRRKTRYTYDLNRRLIKIVDNSGRALQFSYAGDEYLASMTDQDNRTTAWKRDVQGRVIAKQYADGSTFQMAYEPDSGRLREVIDPLSQSKLFSYTVDGRVASVSYVNAIAPTAAAAYKYGKYFPRVEEISDAIGTTTYSYHKVGSLGALAPSKEVGPYGPGGTISYSYDPLGRVTGRQVGEIMETYTYDTEGRLVEHTSPLGQMSIEHLGETDEITSRRLKDSFLSIHYQFGGSMLDRRLTTISSSTPNKSLDYTSDADGGVKSVTLLKEGDSASGVAWNYTRDDENRLVTANRAAGDFHTFSYDSSNNLATVVDATGIHATQYNELNQIVSRDGAPFSYDLNGNLVSDGIRRFEWDAEDRLVRVRVSSVDPGVAQSDVSFRYDGLGRRVGATFTGDDGITHDRKYVWSGENICQVWNEVDKLIRVYVADGEIRPLDGKRYFYVRDNVASVIAMVDVATESIVFSATYLPFGVISAEVSEKSPDFQFGGMMYESLSRLHLAPHRAYDAFTGRWISRDPLGEQSGVNMYAYCDNDPLTSMDADGLINWISWGDTAADYWA